jgi:hypothetical protein
VTTRPLAGRTTGGTPKLAVGELGQTVHSLASFQNDARTITAVAAIGTTTGNILFAPETDATISTSPGPELDFDTVNKHGNRLLNKRFWPPTCVVGAEEKRA